MIGWSVVQARVEKDGVCADDAILKCYRNEMHCRAAEALNPNVGRTVAVVGLAVVALTAIVACARRAFSASARPHES